MTNVDLSTVRSALDDSGIADNKKQQIMSQVARARALETDPWVYRIVVFALGLAIFAPLIGQMGPGGKDALLQLLPISTAAIGGLVGLIAPSPVSRS